MYIDNDKEYCVVHELTVNNKICENKEYSDKFN